MFFVCFFLDHNIVGSSLTEHVLCCIMLMSSSLLLLALVVVVGSMSFAWWCCCMTKLLRYCCCCMSTMFGCFSQKARKALVGHCATKSAMAREANNVVQVTVPRGHCCLIRIVAKGGSGEVGDRFGEDGGSDIIPDDKKPAMAANNKKEMSKNAAMATKKKKKKKKTIQKHHGKVVEDVRKDQTERLDKLQRWLGRVCNGVTRGSLPRNTLTPPNGSAKSASTSIQSNYDDEDDDDDDDEGQ